MSSLGPSHDANGSVTNCLVVESGWTPEMSRRYVYLAVPSCGEVDAKRFCDSVREQAIVTMPCIR